MTNQTTDEVGKFPKAPWHAPLPFSLREKVARSAG
jgi:hypothetical protein